MDKLILKEKMTRKQTGVKSDAWRTEEQSFIATTKWNIMNDSGISMKEAERKAKDMWDWANS